MLPGNQNRITSKQTRKRNAVSVEEQLVRLRDYFQSQGMETRYIHLRPRYLSLLFTLMDSDMSLNPPMSRIMVRIHGSDSLAAHKWAGRSAGEDVALAPGWNVSCTQRSSGKSEGHIDFYYHPPRVCTQNLQDHLRQATASNHRLTKQVSGPCIT